MITRTLYFSKPAYLKCRQEQLVVEYPEQPKNDHYSPIKGEHQPAVPIEDIGLIILDNHQITITTYLLHRLLAQNVGIITCNEKHLPTGMMLNLDGHTLQSAKVNDQINASIPLKKQLWKQTIEAKIKNQSSVLDSINVSTTNMLRWREEIKSGDSENKEATASVYYWKHIFPQVRDFKRDRMGLPPNNLLNYGYAILRGAMARAIVGSGLLPLLGIFHKNQYNDYCLADDLMEPYRPFIDAGVLGIINQYGIPEELNQVHKNSLINLLTTDVLLDGYYKPLLVALSSTTASLAACYEGKSKKITYPLFP